MTHEGFLFFFVVIQKILMVMHKVLVIVSGKGKKNIAEEIFHLIDKEEIMSKGK